MDTPPASQFGKGAGTQSERPPPRSPRSKARPQTQASSATDNASYDVEDDSQILMLKSKSDLTTAFDEYDRLVDPSIGWIHSIDSIFEKKPKRQNNTFKRIWPIVPGFVRIIIRFERILGRLT